MISPDKSDELVAEQSVNGNKLPMSHAMPTRDEHGRALRLPSFIVVGPPRTGTTWIHEVLHRHATLPGPTKETRFFDLHFTRGLKWYLSHFSKANEGRPLGEVAPTYF